MKLIDADALIEAMQGWDWQELYLPIHFKELIIDEAPTIDAVQVVRCGDCRNRPPEGYCDFYLDGMQDNDYCSYGERRTE